MTTATIQPVKAPSYLESVQEVYGGHFERMTQREKLHVIQEVAHGMEILFPGEIRDEVFELVSEISRILPWIALAELMEALIAQTATSSNLQSFEKKYRVHFNSMSQREKLEVIYRLAHGTKKHFPGKIREEIFYVATLLHMNLFVSDRERLLQTLVTQILCHN